MPTNLYDDPRLVALYDALNPAAADTAFYVALAESAAHVIDLGCGTGLLACELAGRGYRVTGIDPSPQMLKVARGRPSGDRVTWIEGDASALPFVGAADLLVMTGHVAQVFLDDASFLATLVAARRVAPWRAHRVREPQSGGAGLGELDGGTLAASRAKRRWTCRRRVARAARESRSARHRPRRVHDSRALRGETETLRAESELRFRSRDELAQLLNRAGFAHIDWYGDWNRAPVDETSRELIAVAR